MRYLNYFAVFIVISLTSCTKDVDYEYIDQSPIVAVLFSPNGLGDLSFSDNIYRGAEEAAAQYGVRIQILEPGTIEEGEEYLRLMYKASSIDSVKHLCIVSDATYADIIKKHTEMIPNTPSNQMLFLDVREISEKAHTVYLPFYGALYEAGCLAQSMDDVNNVAIFSANNYMPSLVDGVKGFTDGLHSEGDKKLNTYYMGTGIEGFSMADTLYNVSYRIDSVFDMVVPLCGGSVQGLLRYNREHPKSFYTVGIDADMSGYTKRVPFSCLKRMDKVITHCIGQWLSDEGLPHQQTLGLEEGFTEVSIPDEYQPLLKTKLEKIHQNAIQKEKEYEAQQK